MKTSLTSLLVFCGGLLLHAQNTTPASFAGLQQLTGTSNGSSDAEFQRLFAQLRELSSQAELEANQRELISGPDAIRNRGVSPDLATKLEAKLDEIRAWLRQQAQTTSDRIVPRVDIERYELTEDDRRKLNELQPAFQSFNYTIYYYHTLLDNFNRVGARLESEAKKSPDPVSRRARYIDLIKFVFDVRSFLREEYANYRGFPKSEILSKYRQNALLSSENFDDEQNDKLEALETKRVAAEKSGNTATAAFYAKMIKTMEASLGMVSSSVEVWAEINDVVRRQHEWVNKHISNDRQEVNNVVLDVSAATYKGLILAGSGAAPESIEYPFVPEELATPVNLTWNVELFEKVVKHDKFKLKK